MAKKYTQAEWARIQSRLPEEERVPYSESPEATPKADPLAELQASIAESKAQVKAKNIEVPTIALEKAVNSGDVAAIQSAATDLGKAQGLSGSELRTFAYRTAQDAAKGEKPTPPPSDGQFVYDYVWRQDIGGPGGKWTLVKTPIIGGPTGPTGPAGVTSGITDGKTTSGTLTGTSSGTGSSKTYTAPDGRIFTDLNAYNTYIDKTKQEESARVNRSAYDLLYQQFAKYGLQALVTPLEGLIKEGVPASEFAIRLRETDAYQKRFAANKARINKGLAALSEAEYISLEDQYQNIMRNYGMPESYYARGDMGRQEGFEKLIGGDVSAAELETRISSAYNRVINSNPEVVQALKQYYPSITNGDILSYVLDPEKALTDINKKITAAEIGGAAFGAGLGIDVARAEQLGAFGVSKAQAQQGYQSIAEFLPSATKLGEIYAKQGLGPYSQATAETEMFGISGAADAAKKRKQLTQLETAQFSGQVGTAGGALARERAGQF